jgi:hypothetical protein
VRLVEDHRLRTGQQLAETLVLHRQVREQQVVIDHHDVRGLRLAPRGGHVAARVGRTGIAEAVLARRGERSARGIRVAQALDLRKVPGPGLARPAADARQHARVRRGNPGQLRNRLRQLQPVQAQVVRAALQQRESRRTAECLRDGRQVAVEELVLERARAGRDDDLAAGQERRHQVGESLARAGAGLDRHHPARCERLADPVGHELLLTPRLEVRDDARQRPLRAEQPAVFAERAHEPRARAM